MRDLVLAKLKALLARDPAIGVDAKLCENYLLDACNNQNEGEIMALVMAVRKGIATELRDHHGNDSPLLRARFELRLTKGGLRDELASWSVSAWGQVYGRKLPSTPPRPVAPLEPPAPVPVAIAANSVGSTQGQAWTIPDLNLTLMPIQAGHFTMGSTNGDSDEKPRTLVTLTQPYWLGQTEVTQAQWEAVIDDNNSAFKGPSRPVERVSWEEAMAFCEALTLREGAAGRLPAGYAYTLPTEAQWEYACRAGSTSDSAGPLDKMAWYDKNSGRETHPVGTKQPNAWGLFDMHGNVWEWCLDWYGDYLGGKVVDPTGAAEGTYRVLRGGCWHRTAIFCRSASRGGSDPGLRFGNLGFRLALAAPAPVPAVPTAAVARPAPSVDDVKSAAPVWGQEWTIPYLDLTLMPIPAGRFTMGSTNGDPAEKPLTRVTLTQPYWLGKFEVTQAQWEAVMGSNPSGFHGPNLPVEQVSWDEAIAFCEALTQRERAARRLPAGYAYTLPTEAQWEYACRAGSTGDFAGAPEEMAWCGENSGNITHPVGTKQPNEWGLCDMHGNVWEWCWDGYAAYPGGRVIDPTGAEASDYRVYRGGGWYGNASHCRSSLRRWFTPNLRVDLLGFRLALSAGR